MEDIFIEEKISGKNRHDLKEDTNIYILCEVNCNQGRHIELNVVEVCENYKVVNWANMHNPLKVKLENFDHSKVSELG